MKKLQKLTAGLLALVLVLALAACGGGKKDVDLDALAADLTGSAAFSADLMENSGAAATTYGFDPAKVTKCTLYVNTTTAEEIFLAQAADDKAADEIEQLCKSRLEAQTAWMQSYVPEAVPRLENAVLAKSGAYVVLVVADDSAAAKSIVDKYMK